MDIREGREVSFVLVSGRGRAVLSFDEANEQRAREQASERRLRLFRVTKLSEEVAG